MVRLSAMHMISMLLILVAFVLSTFLVFLFNRDLFSASIFSFMNIIGATFPPDPGLLDAQSPFILGSIVLGAIANISFTITLTTIFYQVFSGVDIRYALAKQRLRRASKYVIITPINGMGEELAKRLREGKIDAVFIDENRALVRRVIKKGSLALHGDASKPDVLEQARIGGALGLFALHDDDVKNTFIAIEARRMVKNLRVFSRIKRLEDIAKMERAGARRTMLPEAAVGIEISDFLIANV